MTIWRVGMKAVCIKRTPWVGICFGERGDGPTYDEVCRVTALDESVAFGQFLAIDGYVGFFRACHFRPVTEQRSKNKHYQVLRDLLNTPAKQPETM